MGWKTLLASITGTVDQELRLRHEYLVTEHRILRQQIKGRVRLSGGERKTLAALGMKLGKQALEEVASLVKPDTILAWHRQLVAQKFDGSRKRQAPGRPTIDAELEALVVRLAQENCAWGYDRIVGALANLGYTISDQTVGNILKRHGISPGARHQGRRRGHSDRGAAQNGRGSGGLTPDGDGGEGACHGTRRGRGRASAGRGPDHGRGRGARPCRNVHEVHHHW
jgi:hypothetical protein